MEIHMKDHSGEKCEYYGEISRSKTDLERHIQLTHVIECSQCEFKAPKFEYLKEHLNNSHSFTTDWRSKLQV